MSPLWSNDPGHLAVKASGKARELLQTPASSWEYRGTLERGEVTRRRDWKTPEAYDAPGVFTFRALIPILTPAFRRHGADFQRGQQA